MRREYIRSVLGVAPDNPMFEAFVAFIGDADPEAAVHLAAVHREVVGGLLRAQLDAAPGHEYVILGNVGSDICAAVTESSGWVLEQDQQSIYCRRKELG